MSILPAQQGDLERAEELTVRTNQLNTTGYAYSYEELDRFRCAADKALLIVSLEDKYGSYGKIGLALVERGPAVWTIKLLLMSCRVMSRGIGTVLLSHILGEAKAAGVRLLADFVTNDRNRMMYATYKFAGFKEIEKTERTLLLEHDLGAIQAIPSYVQLHIGSTGNQGLGMDSQAAAIPLLLRGPSEVALREQATGLAAELRECPESGLSAAAWKLLEGRHWQPVRAAVVVKQREQAIAALTALAQGRPDPRVLVGRARSSSGVVLVFPGLGSQWPGMARALYAELPVFAATVDACDQALQPYTQDSVRQLLLAPDAEQAQAFAQADRVQPALFTMALGLARTWESYGVVPAAVVGHSQGEIAAACVAGLLSLDDAARVVAVRSRLLKAQAGHGSMAMVALPLDEVTRRLAGYEGRVSIAAANGPSWTTVGGEAEAVHTLLGQWQQQQVYCQPMAVDYASHGPQVDRCIESMRGELAGLRPQPGKAAMISTVEGRQVDASALTADYWVRNLREPVRLDLAVEHLEQRGFELFLEVSANPQLLGPLMELLEEEEGVVGSLKKGHGGRAGLLQSAVELQLAGCELDWTQLQDGPSPRSSPVT